MRPADGWQAGGVSTSGPAATPPAPRTPAPGPAGAPLHHERLWPSPGAWLLPLVPGAFIAVAFGPVSLPLSVSLGVVVTIACAAALAVTSPVVEVTADGVLRAGRAALPGRFVAAAGSGRGLRARAMRGTDLDARTHLLLRGWVDPMVLVVLDDPEDPVPSWLVSTRRPEHLVRAVLAVAPPAAADLDAEAAARAGPVADADQA